MSSIKIVTDSAADLPLEFFTSFNIDRVPHYVIIDDKSIKVGQDLSLESYYHQIQETGVIPSSSTPSLEDYHTIFQKAATEGFEELIYISVSGALSSSSNVARLAAKNSSIPVTIIDSRRASGAQGLLVLQAAKLVQEGKKVNEIVSVLNGLIGHSILVVGFITLDNVYRSGRLKSKFILNMTKFLKIKPIAMIVEPGILKSKFPGWFTEESMVKRLYKLAIKKANKDFTYNLMISHLNNQEGTEKLAELIKNKLSINESYSSVCSPIIATNTGEKTLILSLVPTKVPT